MNERLRRLRDAVTGRDREVEVDPDGQVREVLPPEPENEKTEPRPQKPTKLAARTFGLI